MAWHEDGESLWVFRRDELPAPVYRVWIESGERELWRELMPSDVNGVYTVGEFVINRHGDAYFYSYKRRFSELYLVRLPQ